MPDGAIDVIDGNNSVAHAHSLLGSIDIAPDSRPFRIVSKATPPLFAETTADSASDRVEVIPLVQVLIDSIDSFGNPVTLSTYDIATRIIAAETVTQCIQQGQGVGTKVARLMESQAVTQLATGQSVPGDASVCLLCVGNDLIRVEPAHSAWYGVDPNGRSRTPIVSGGRCPVTSAVSATTGNVCKVTVVVGRPGSIEVDLNAWKAGAKATFVVRRAGRSGHDTSTKSWTIAAEAETTFDRSNKDGRVCFPNLTPGDYKIDALLSRSETDKETSILYARVTDGKTTYLDISSGVGAGMLVLSRPRDAKEATLLLCLRLPAPPAGLGTDFPDWASVVTVERSRAASLTIHGLLGVSGTLTLLLAESAKSIDIDLSARSNYELAQE